MKKLVAVLALVVAIASAASAQADAHTYLDYLHTHGGPAWPDGNMVSGGLHLCDLMRSGMSPQEAVGSLGVFGGAFATPVVVEAAQHELCPDTLR